MNAARYRVVYVSLDAAPEKAGRTSCAKKKPRRAELAGVWMCRVRTPGPDGPASLGLALPSRRPQRDFLHAPVGHLADQELVLRAAVDRVRETKLLRQF